MSITGSIVGASGMNFPAQLAGTSANRQTAKSPDDAVQDGKLPATEVFARMDAKAKAPKTAATDSSAASKTATDKAFQNLAEAIISKKSDAVRAAWKEIYLGVNHEQANNVSPPGNASETPDVQTRVPPTNTTHADAFQGHTVIGHGTVSEQLIHITGTANGETVSHPAKHGIYEPHGGSVPETSRENQAVVLDTIA